MPLDLKATIVTNSPPVALALTEHAGVEVILLGGRLFKEAQVMVGAAAVEAMRAYPRRRVRARRRKRAPRGWGSASWTTRSPWSKSTMLAAATDIIVLATADKLDKVAPFPGRRAKRRPLPHHREARRRRSPRPLPRQHPRPGRVTEFQRASTHRTPILRRPMLLGAGSGPSGPGPCVRPQLMRAWGDQSHRCLPLAAELACGATD